MTTAATILITMDDLETAVPLNAAFEEAGFYGTEILARQSEPWAVVEGIEFRSLMLQAFKGKQGPCLDRKQAVIYTGPWKAVIDDNGHLVENDINRLAVLSMEVVDIGMS